mmetsp:Transcript_7147/g.16239  ORF Transcript_7147/g.16239 Transcript_7147/m.16239 type:complete len:99 (-) Transcript_7147:217-513(-)
MSLKLGPADGMGLSFSARCCIPFVITAGLGSRHWLFVSENFKKPVMDWFLVWPGTRSFIVGKAIPGSAQDCTARASYFHAGLLCSNYNLTILRSDPCH